MKRALFATTAVLALVASTSFANAADCYSGEQLQVVLRFPVTDANVPIPGINLNVKSDSCAPATKPSYTIDGMPGKFTSRDAAVAFVKTAISMRTHGTAFESTEDLAKAISFVLDLDDKYQKAAKTVSGGN